MSELEIEFQIIVDNGKYIFISYRGDYHIHCLRYGEPWMIYEKGSSAISAIMYDYEQLQAKNKRLRHAISPFVSFKHFIDCLCETQHEKPFTEHDCICSAMGSGGSDYIWYKDLMIAEQILKEE